MILISINTNDQYLFYSATVEVFSINPSRFKKINRQMPTSINVSACSTRIVFGGVVSELR